MSFGSAVEGCGCVAALTCDLATKQIKPLPLVQVCWYGLLGGTFFFGGGPCLASPS